MMDTLNSKKNRYAKPSVANGLLYATVTVRVCTEKYGRSRPITCELTYELLFKMAIYQDFGYQSVIMYNQVTICIM